MLLKTGSAKKSVSVLTRGCEVYALDTHLTNCQAGTPLLVSLIANECSQVSSRAKPWENRKNIVKLQCLTKTQASLVEKHQARPTIRMTNMSSSSMMRQRTVPSLQVRTCHIRSVQTSAMTSRRLQCTQPKTPPKPLKYSSSRCLVELCDPRTLKKSGNRMQLQSSNQDIIGIRLIALPFVCELKLLLPLTACFALVKANHPEKVSKFRPSVYSAARIRQVATNEATQLRKMKTAKCIDVESIEARTYEGLTSFRILNCQKT